LFLAWLCLGRHLELSCLHVQRIRRLYQQSAADALEVELVMSVGQRHGEHAHVLFCRGDLERCLGGARRDDEFDELVGGDLRRAVGIQFAVEGDDAAERRSGVGRVGQFVGVERSVGDRHAAGVGVLDDDTGGLIEGLDQFPCGIGIAYVVVGQFLALQLGVVGNAARHRVEVAVERRALMRVLAVTHLLHLGEIEIDLRRERALGAVRIDRGEIVADRAVVGSGMRKRLLRQIETRGVGDGSVIGLHFGQHRSVVGRVGDDGNVAVVLCRRAHHGRAADVDVFDGILQRATRLGDGLRKRVQIYHHQVDRRNVVFFERCNMLRQIAPRQDARVYLGLQGLHASVQHLRKAGVIRHFGDRDAVFGEQPGGAAGGEDFYAELVQSLREFENAGFIRHADECLFDCCHDGSK